MERFDCIVFYILYCVRLCCVVLYCIVLYCIVLYGMVWYCMEWYGSYNALWCGEI